MLRIPNREQNISTFQPLSYSDALRMPTIPQMFSQPERKCQMSTHLDVFVMKCVIIKMYWYPRWFGQIHYDSIPFVGRPEGHIVTLVAILDKHPDRLDEPPLSDGAWEVIQQCWTREPLKRQRMKDVIESLISAISWQSISLSISARVSEHPSTFNSFQEPRRRDTRSFADTSTDTFPLDILLKILRDKQVRCGQDISSV